MNRPTILSMWIFPLMAACSLVRIAPAINPTADWFETGERVSVREWDGKALEELPAFLFRQYLEKCKGTEIDGARRLIDYQILSVTDVGFLPEYILADVQYSVEPVRFLYSDWNAGNGESREGDAWIRNKIEKAAVQRGSEWYILKLVGTA